MLSMGVFRPRPLPSYAQKYSRGIILRLFARGYPRAQPTGDSSMDREATMNMKSKDFLAYVKANFDQHGERARFTGASDEAQV